jgi:hypothetical protein
MLMMLAGVAALSASTDAWIPLKTPVRLIATMRSQSAGG